MTIPGQAVAGDGIAAGARPSPPRWALWVAIAIFLDQSTKAVVYALYEDSLAPFDWIWPNANPDGVMSSHPAVPPWVTGCIACAAIVVAYFRWFRSISRPTDIGFALLAGGAIGNTIDRLACLVRGGDGVRDWILVSAGTRLGLKPFVIDLADGFVAVGIVLVASGFASRRPSLSRGR